MPLTRLLRLLTMVAMLFSPISMAGGHAAMAMPAAAAGSMADHMSAAAPAGHCADMDKQTDKGGPTAPNIDCTIACSAMPSADFEVEARAMPAGFIEPEPLATALHGLHPESDPPPPRIS